MNHRCLRVHLLPRLYPSSHQLILSLPNRSDLSARTLTHAHARHLWCGGRYEVALSSHEAGLKLREDLSQGDEDDGVVQPELIESLCAVRVAMVALPRWEC